MGATPSHAQTIPLGDEICRKHSNCRPLTSGEVRLAQVFFGSSIDYSNIRIVQARFWGMVPSGRSSTMAAPNGHIYVSNVAYSNDYAQSEKLSPFFIHEMAHVWQKYDRKNVVLKGALLAMNIFRDPYTYTLNPKKSFRRYSIEQQAQMLQHGYTYEAFLQSDGQLYSETYAPKGYAYACTQWTVINDIVSTAGLSLGRKPDLCR